MRTALAVSAALLLAGTAYVQSAHAQMAQPTPGAVPQAQPQSDGSMTSGNQPAGTAAQTQPWTAGQTRSSTTTPKRTQSTATGGPMGAQAQSPQGSFRSSCNDLRMQNDTVIALLPKA
jgi:hypothetical protein